MTALKYDQLDEKAKSVAISKVSEWIWEGLDSDAITDDLMYTIKENHPYFDIIEKDFQWDMYNFTTQGTGYIHIKTYLTYHKLRNKYRLLWAAMQKYDIDVDCYGTFSLNYYHPSSINMEELTKEIEYCCDHGFDKEDQKPYYAYINSLAEDIKGDLAQMGRNIRDAIKQQCYHLTSTEYAMDTIEEMEFLFFPDGQIYYE